MEEKELGKNAFNIAMDLTMHFNMLSRENSVLDMTVALAHVCSALFSSQHGDDARKVFDEAVQHFSNERRKRNEKNDV